MAECPRRVAGDMLNTLINVYLLTQITSPTLTLPKHCQETPCSGSDTRFFLLLWEAERHKVFKQQ